MRNIKDILVCENMVLESIIEPHIHELAKQLGAKNMRMKDVIWKPIALDEIDSSDVKVYKNINKAVLREISNNIKNYSVISVGLINGVVKITVAGEATKYLIPDNPIDNNNRYHVFTNELSKYWNPYPARHERAHKNAYLDAFEHCDEVWIIDASEYDATDKQHIRVEHKKGIVLNTPEYYQKVASENMERYKKILANKQYFGDSQINELNKRVQELFTEYMNMLADFNMHQNKYTDYKIRQNIAYSDTLMDNIVKGVGKYSKQLYELKEYIDKQGGTTDSYFNTKYYKEKVNNTKNELVYDIEKLKVYLEKVKNAVNG